MDYSLEDSTVNTSINMPINTSIIMPISTSNNANNQINSALIADTPILTATPLLSDPFFEPFTLDTPNQSLLSELQTQIHIDQINNNNNININDDNVFTNVFIHEPQSKNKIIEINKINETQMETNKSQFVAANLEQFRFRGDTANWCDYCAKDMFIHKKSCEKFITKCISRYHRNITQFFNDRISHMLGSILHLEVHAQNYLEIKCPALYARYKSNIYPSSLDSRCYIVPGIVRQYNEMEYISNVFRFTKNNHVNTNYVNMNNINNNINNDNNDNDNNININKTFVSIKADEIYDWLKLENIMCSNCFCYACPFHNRFGDFEVRTYNEKQMYLCGWCNDKYLAYCVIDNGKSSSNQNIM